MASSVLHDLMWWLLLLMVLVMVLGGSVVCMVGLLWYKFAALLKIFGKEIDPEKGYKIAMIGFVMLVIGIGLVYLQTDPTAVEPAPPVEVVDPIPIEIKEQPVEPAPVPPPPSTPPAQP
jgi:hypothetical protein